MGGLGGRAAGAAGCDSLSGLARIRHPHARVALFLTALFALSYAPVAKSLEELSEHLQALGYLEWDEDTDVDKQGVVHFEPERAAPGYNLYTDDRDQIFLMDLVGKRVHTWRVPAELFNNPDKHCEHALLLRNGSLAVICSKQGLAVLDWNGKATYSARGSFHHDVVELPNGNLLTPARIQQVEYAGRAVTFDGLRLLSLSGGGLDVWSSKDYLAELKQHHPPLELDTPPAAEEATDTLHDYYHLNSVQRLPDTKLGREDSRFREGNLLLSLRNANLILVIDRDSRRVVWSYGPGVLELQHAPTMLANGNILIFDNGAQRGHSRVLELEPRSGAIAWEYKGKPSESFFSKWRGIAQRLPNGNTLITESERGHVFEVTHEGEIVWDFWNPEIQKSKRKRIYRMIRLPPDRVQKQLKLNASPPPR